MGLRGVGKLTTILGGVALALQLLGVASTSCCGSRSAGLLRFFAYTFLLLAMAQFGASIFLFVESGNRTEGSRAAWLALADGEQAAVEASRQCCGWLHPREESPQCRWADKGPCGPGIAAKQRDTLVMLGGLMASLAAVELLLFGMGGWLSRALRCQRRQERALEEVRAQRKASLKERNPDLAKLVS
jgi:hypothetical protein